MSMSDNNGARVPRWAGGSRRGSLVSGSAEAGRRCQFILANTGDVIWVLEAATRRLTYVSPSAERVFGYTPEELLGQGFALLLVPGTECEAMTLLHERIRAFEAGDRSVEIATDKVTHVRKDGTMLPVEVVTRLVADEGNHVSDVLGVSRDISQRTLLEAEFVHAQKMEAVGRLAGSVAHEINNALTAVLGYANLALRSVDPAGPLAADIREIQEAAGQATHLTRQLLTFSRREPAAVQVVDVPGLVRRIRPLLERWIGEDITLSIEGEASSVRAAPEDLEQILVSLAVNARGAMSGGGIVTIRMADVVVPDEPETGEVAPGDYVLLTVDDTGRGMSPVVASQIFEPFFTINESGRGTGLGLATVHSLVSRSGGHITVASEVGRGSRFSVYLPRVTDTAQTPCSGAIAGQRRSGVETVLVVDDEEPVRRLVRVTLRRGGYRVVEASDGEQALKVCRREQRDVALVVTDVVMPRLGGAALAQWLRSVNPRVRILYLSGYIDDGIEAGGVRVAGSSFLRKPFSADALLRAVREALDSPSPVTGPDSSRS